MRQSFYLYIIDAPLDSWVPIADALQGALRPTRLNAALTAIKAGTDLVNEIVPGAFTGEDCYARETHQGWEFRVGNCICSTYPIPMTFEFRVQLIP